MFDEVCLTWKGEDYTVEPDNVLRLIAKVEDVITLGELFQYSSRGGAPLAKLAMSYGIMLRYAGVHVKDDDVYQALATGGADGIIAATNTLLQMMVPPSDLVEATDSEGKTESASN